MSSLYLDPTKITGDITSNTPLCIVKIVAELSKISLNVLYWGLEEYTDQFNTIIKSQSFYQVFPPLDETNHIIIGECIRFLNPFVGDDAWTLESVNLGLTNVISFVESGGTVTWDEISFGQKDDSNPLRINELMSYRICKEFNYELRKETEMDEILYAARALLNEEELPGLRKIAIENLKRVPNSVVVKMNYGLGDIGSHPIQRIKVDADTTHCCHDQHQIERAFRFLNDKTLLQYRAIPENNYEAIILGAIRFKVCLADAKNPLLQFLNILESGLTSSDVNLYTPISDSDFCINYTKNPSWYSTKSNWFEELMPIYSNEELEKFAKLEGIHERKLDTKNIPSFLLKRRKTLCVFFGIVPYCKHTKTAIYHTPIEEIPSEQLVCYGNISEDNLYYMSIAEFTESLSHSKVFIDPIFNKPLSQYSINKYRTYILGVEKTSSNRHIFSEAIEAVNMINDIKTIIDYRVRNLVTTVKTSSEDVKIKIQQYFEKCLEMGLYMRGWKHNGKEGFPLKREDCIIQSDKVEFVYQLMWDTYVQSLEILCDIPTEIADDIKNVHLIRFSRIGDVSRIFEYKFSGLHVNPDETLLETMEQSVKGDLEKNSSCIRSNSNWILFSAAWYNYILGFDVPFRFDQIDEILYEE